MLLKRHVAAKLLALAEQIAYEMSDVPVFDGGKADLARAAISALTAAGELADAKEPTPPKPAKKTESVG